MAGIQDKTYSKFLVAKNNMTIKMTCQVLDKHMTDDYEIHILILPEF